MDTKIVKPRNQEELNLVSTLLKRMDIRFTIRKSEKKQKINVQPRVSVKSSKSNS